MIVTKRPNPSSKYADGFSSCNGNGNDGDASLYPIEIENELYCGVSNYEYSLTNVDFLSRQQSCIYKEGLQIQNSGDEQFRNINIDVTCCELNFQTNTLSLPELLTNRHAS